MSLQYAYCEEKEGLNAIRMSITSDYLLTVWKYAINGVRYEWSIQLDRFHTFKEMDWYKDIAVVQIDKAINYAVSRAEKN